MSSRFRVFFFFGYLLLAIWEFSKGGFDYIDVDKLIKEKKKIRSVKWEKLNNRLYGAEKDLSPHLTH